MDDTAEFREITKGFVVAQGRDRKFHEATLEWVTCAAKHSHTHCYSWLGLPIIQFPQDIVAMQEIIWQVKPDLIIETGIARGGSLIFYASMLQLLGRGDVLGIDIDIRPHNRAAIESHPMASRITMFEGSSVTDEMAARVRDFASGHHTVMVVLDSNHTHAHVLRELELYAPLVTRGSYCVVFDTIVEDMPPGSFPDRPWDVGDNPKTAVHAYLKSHPEFQIDASIPDKLQITVAPDGYLKRMP